MAIGSTRGSDAAFLTGGGKMGALIRAQDWSASPLGAPDTWPKSLRSAMQICLSIPIPGAVHWGPDLRILYNDAYAPALAERHPWALGRPFGDVWADIWDVLGPQIASVMETGCSFSTEHQLLKMHRNGRIEDTYWIYSFAPLYDAGGEVAGIFVTALDTTDKVVAERRLVARLGTASNVTEDANSDQSFTRLFQASPAPFLVLAVDAPRFTIREVNEAYLAATMTKRESIVGRGVFEAFPDNPDDPAIEGVNTLRASLERVLATREPDRLPGLKYDVARPNGGFEERWWSPVNSPVLNEQGEVEALIHNANDVTDERRTEAALRASEARLRELNETLESQVRQRTAELQLHRDIIESSAAPIVAFDAEFRVIVFNKAHSDTFLRMFGHDAAYGEVLPDLFPADQAASLRGYMARALAGEVFSVIEAFGDPDLARPCFEAHYAPLREEEGHIIGAFQYAQDITARLEAEAELAQAQEALRQSQKMEAMGSLTGGVAHDFNNLLTPIVGSLDLLQRRGVGGEREQRLIAGAIQSADRAKTLVQRLLAFARRQPLQPTAVDVGGLVHGMADLLGSTTGPQVRVVVEVAADLPPAKADLNQLEMALLNLGVNARDAMPNGGTLTITATRETVRSPRGQLKRGDYVRLSVADTGTGMDEATMARAVEPFFSTKGIGKGTGLGLSMAHGLAAQLGGALTIQSKQGLGTNIELWLAISAVAADIVEAGAPASLDQADGLVLLVDDEEVVRMSTADMLEELGYEVRQAESAEAALALVDQGLVPNLLVTDHLMPGMSGVDLARVLRDRFSALHVLIVSGYAEAEGIAPDLPRLTKPFRSAELEAFIARLNVSTANPS